MYELVGFMNIYHHYSQEFQISLDSGGDSEGDGGTDGGGGGGSYGSNVSGGVINIIYHQWQYPLEL